MQEINTLINLLDDPDTVVFDAVASHFIEEGLSTIPVLEKVMEESRDENVCERIRTIIWQIHTRSVHDGMRQWIDSPYHNLLEGAYWVAKLHYPDLTMQWLEGALDDIQKDILICTSDDDTPMSNKLKIFNHLFYHTHTYKRTTDTHNPIYCFINQVLEMQCGNSISLGLLYLHLAQQNGWSLQGVCLPDVFLVARTNKAGEVLSYINPYNRGLTTGKSSITVYFEQHGIQPRPEYYLPCDNIMVVLRLIEYLIYACKDEGDDLLADTFRALLPVFGNRSTHFMEGI
jgi:hypothetical protein